jgi:RNA polymerase sigma-70 factor, ECF subfamily
VDVGLSEKELLDRLREGDEQAFVTLVGRYHGSLTRLARSFVSSAAVAEEVVQDTWLAVICGISRFEGRSSLKTWLFRILVNRARTTGARESRSIAIGEPGPAVDASRFDEAGRWAQPPEHWADDADDRVRAAMLADRIRSALGDLPARQRQVVVLRDVEGLSSEEVCSVLKISMSNQRVLLHRGRSRLRQALESEFGRP